MGRRHTNGQQTHEKLLNVTQHQGNTNQNHNEIPPHTTTDVGEDAKKGNLPTLLVGM